MYCTADDVAIKIIKIEKESTCRCHRGVSGQSFMHRLGAVCVHRRCWKLPSTVHVQPRHFSVSSGHEPARISIAAPTDSRGQHGRCQHHDKKGCPPHCRRRGFLCDGTHQNKVHHGTTDHVIPRPQRAAKQSTKDYGQHEPRYHHGQPPVPNQTSKSGDDEYVGSVDMERPLKVSRQGR